MKKFILLVLITSLGYSQERTSLSLGIEPKAFEKDGFNSSFKINHETGHGYLGVGLFIFPNLNNIGYYSLTGFGGINLTSCSNDRHRMYLGGVLGLARREVNTYPLAGYEGGYDFYITKSFAIGINGSMHYRADSDFYDGPKNVFNGEVKIIYKIGKTVYKIDRIKYIKRKKNR